MLLEKHPEKKSLEPQLLMYHVPVMDLGESSYLGNKTQCRMQLHTQSLSFRALPLAFSILFLFFIFLFFFSGVKYIFFKVKKEKKKTLISLLYSSWRIFPSVRGKVKFQCQPPLPSGSFRVCLVGGEIKRMEKKNERKVRDDILSSYWILDSLCFSKGFSL